MRRKHKKEIAGRHVVQTPRVRRHWSFEKFWNGPLPKVITLCVVGVALLIVFFRMSGNASIDALPAIRERGTVLVGLLDNEPPFSTVEDNATAAGFEVDLANLLGQQILGGPGVVYVPVTVKNDEALLDNGDVDFLISRVPVTEARQKKYNLSSVYYQDPVLLLAKTGAAVDLASADTKLGVIPSTTMKPMLTSYLAAVGSPALVVDVSSYPDAVQMLKSGKIQAFCAEQSVLTRYAENGLSIQNTKIGQLDYAVVTRKRERDLATLIEKALAQMRTDGTLAPFYQKYGLAAPQLDAAN